nr:hypothetical protein CFP56_25859 [Quercus suber]
MKITQTWSSVAPLSTSIVSIVSIKSPRSLSWHHDKFLSAEMATSPSLSAWEESWVRNHRLGTPSCMANLLRDIDIFILQCQSIAALKFSFTPVIRHGRVISNRCEMD